jgi:glycyl-tRNA synthetase
MSKFNQDFIVNYLKENGFVFQGSEIYNGLSNTWDYGPLGSLLKNNIKDLWIEYFVKKQKNSFLIDSSIIINPTVWKTSGHIDGFSDPLVDCKNCKERYRADKLAESNTSYFKNITDTQIVAEENKNLFNDKKFPCPKCKSINWTEIRKFNLMFKSNQGPIEDDKNIVYLRPETAQGIFINFRNVQRTTRAKLPFSICQIGKAFRNEITPGNFIFRTREFEQMEIEHFTFADKADNDFNVYLESIKKFLFEVLRIKETNIRSKEIDKDNLAHYSKRTVDFEYEFPHGFSELWGIANRTDFDLKSHSDASGHDLSYFDPYTNTRSMPNVIEPSVGVDRLMYAIICDSLIENTIAKDGKEENRIFLSLPYKLSPYKVAILPLTNKLSEEAEDAVYNLMLDNNISCTFDSKDSIGKRYRKQDLIGTFYCITYDFDSNSTNMVTIRKRDSMEQIKVLITDIVDYINNRENQNNDWKK